MAITQAMCTSFKTELLTATHNFATNGNAFKLALYAIGGGGKSEYYSYIRCRIYSLRHYWGSSCIVVHMLLEVVALTKVAPTSCWNYCVH